jgi:hypothetical protein
MKKRSSSLTLKEAALLKRYIKRILKEVISSTGNPSDEEQALKELIEFQALVIAKNEARIRANVEYMRDKRRDKPAQRIESLGLPEELQALYDEKYNAYREFLGQVKKLFTFLKTEHGVSEEKIAELQQLLRDKVKEYKSKIRTPPPPPSDF